MKMQNFNLRTSILALAAGAMIFTSCDKQDNNPATANPNTPEQRVITDKQVKDKLVQLAGKAPSIAVYNSTMDKVIVFDPNNAKDGFNFTSPNDGWNFGVSGGLQFVESPDGSGIIFITPGALNGGSSGGSVVAGDLSLDIILAICFTASDDVMYLDMLDSDVPMDGISGVIGIGGDLEALQTADLEGEDFDMSDLQIGIAYYIVYDDQASGNYPILNADDEFEDSNYLQDKGFAFIMSLGGNGAGFYMSTSGDLEVSGGSMTFEGTYAALLAFFDEEGGEIDAVEVDGFGTMGCD